MTRNRKILRFLLKASRQSRQLLSNPYYWGFVVAKKLVWLAVAYFAFAQPAQALEYEDYPVVKLRSLDKITARTMTFEAKVGSTVRFGEIYIKVQSCRKPPPVEKSEAAAFLQIWQANEAKETSKWIFSGWMFASSPALSAMDHPVYDVWVLDCLGRDPEPIPVPDKNTGVQAPETDGEAPDAVPPTVEPDKQVTPAPDGDTNVTREDDPGAFEETEQPVSAPVEENKTYAPPEDAPDSYRDETPADDTSPQDDTVLPEQTVPAQTPETLEPQQEQEQDHQEFQGIY